MKQDRRKKCRPLTVELHAIKIWKLTPIKLNSPHMEASWHKDYAIVRAPSADAARELAKAHLSIAVERSGLNTLFSPWGQHDVVTCAAYGGSHFDEDGGPGVLHPKV
ncbi:MAG: hypothetical protein HOP33_21445 [Verrucomicrobia bacterium]|nr:hypothetical protein [Verrucomicrobiota bacterium]